MKGHFRRNPAFEAPLVGATAAFNELMALRGRKREDEVNADAAHWEPQLRAGIAQARQAGRESLLAGALLVRADAALYRAKAEGRARLVAAAAPGASA